MPGQFEFNVKLLSGIVERKSILEVKKVEKLYDPCIIRDFDDSNCYIYNALINGGLTEAGSPQRFFVYSEEPPAESRQFFILTDYLISAFNIDTLQPYIDISWNVPCMSLVNTTGWLGNYYYSAIFPFDPDIVYGCSRRRISIYTREVIGNERRLNQIYRTVSNPKPIHHNSFNIEHSGVVVVTIPSTSEFIDLTVDFVENQGTYLYKRIPSYSGQYANYIGWLSEHPGYPNPDIINHATGHPLNLDLYQIEGNRTIWMSGRPSIEYGIKGRCSIVYQANFGVS